MSAPRLRSLLGRAGGALAALAVLVALAAALALAVEAGRVRADNRLLGELVDTGRDVAVAPGARVARLEARLYFLLYRDRLEEAHPLIEALVRRGGDARAVAALYNGGNARLRRAIDLIEDGRFDDAGAHVALAKDYYRRALRRDPQAWDVKVNFDIANRISRDFPRLGRTQDEEEPDAPEQLWTDLPGQPRGLP